ncbi:hypothetical protein F5Y09DRAFT_337276 [Xylaria sp. FL1042]|nr:hypothetical protein F5Y09DRAFT_337276 [Xylaria sp. FL1042]
MSFHEDQNGNYVYVAGALAATLAVALLATESASSSTVLSTNSTRVTVATSTVS